MKRSVCLWIGNDYGTWAREHKKQDTYELYVKYKFRVPLHGYDRH